MTQACISPLEINEKQLLMYLYGEADKETTLHLQQCDYCRKRAETLGSFQTGLTNQLHRVTCPSAMELGEYYFDLLYDRDFLPAPQKLRIVQHVRQCPHCTRELAELKDFLIEEPQPGFMGSVKILIARLMGNGNQASQFPLAPALRGLRGKGGEPLIYQADEVQIVIDIQNETEQPDRKIILGLLTGAESKLFSAQLRSHDGEVIVTVAVNEIGNFVIPHLIAGQYELRLSSPHIEIRILTLAV